MWRVLAQAPLALKRPVQTNLTTEEDRPAAEDDDAE